MVSPAQLGVARHFIPRCGSGAERALIAVRCSEEAVVKSATYRDIAWHFGVLGWTAVSSWGRVRLLEYMLVHILLSVQRDGGTHCTASRLARACSMCVLIRLQPACSLPAVACPGPHRNATHVCVPQPARRVPAQSLSYPLRPLCAVWRPRGPHRHVPKAVCGQAAVVHLRRLHRAAHAGPVYAR